MKTVDELKNQIKSCDEKKPYIFVSYKKDDAEKVYPIVVNLQNKGVNIWIDKELESHGGTDWQEPALDAIKSPNCKVVLFFLSKRSLVSGPVLAELSYCRVKGVRLKHGMQKVNIISYDLDSLIEGYGEVEKYIISEETAAKLSKEIDCKELKKYFPKERFPSPAIYNNIKDEQELAAAVAKAAGLSDGNVLVMERLDSILNTLNKKYKDVIRIEAGDKETAKNEFFVEKSNEEADTPVFDEKEGEITKPSMEESADKRIAADTEEKRDPVDKEDAPAPSAAPAEGYKYTIFGVEYEAGSGEQGKLMFDAFEALVKRYPECAEQLTQRTSIARAEDVKDANTQKAYPTYFRGCKSFNVGGREYLVGTSYGYKAKIAEIKGMFKICGVDLCEFVLNGEPLGAGKAAGESAAAQPEKDDDAFEYELWGGMHCAGSMADMMHNVFDLIAEKYPSRVPDMADDQSITSVARKDDVDNKKLPSSKLNYFKAKREHSVSGVAYYVSTHYNREQGLGQLKKMLVLCEGNLAGLTITKMPGKNTHSATKTGKQGLGELLEEK